MSGITLNFLSGQAYPTLKRRGIEVGSSLGHDLSLKYGKTFANTSPKMINGLGPCVGVGIFSPTQKFLAHSAPELDTHYNNITQLISKTIYNIIESSKCKQDEVSAVIYGGIAYDDNNPLSVASCNLVDAIESGCKAEGIDPTIITGQYSDGLNTRIDSYIGNGQITMWGKLIDKIRWDNNTPLSEIQIILEKFFEYVKLTKSTTLKSINSLPHQAQSLNNK